MVLFCSTVSAIILLINCLNASNADYTTELVTVLFRHGDRTPDATSLYPRDPYINATYFPIGIGQLTSKGKRREFALGQLIRKRYDAFLGNVYFPGQVDAISTDMNRTKASLELVLAGVYPPKSTGLEWNPSLNWDPIGYNYLSYESDLWMTISTEFCANYDKRYQEYLASPIGQHILKKNSELYQYLTYNTGLNVTQPIHVWGIYSCLLSEDEWGYKLPLWSRSVYPDLLEEATVEALLTLVATRELKQLSGGFMLQRIIDNMNAKVENRLEPENRKLFLYSAHDINILYMSGVLNQAIKHSIPYGSYYIIELVKARGAHYVQVYSNDYITQELIRVKIPGCEFQCPLKQFEKLLQSNIPTKATTCGTDIKHEEKHKYKRNVYLGKLAHKHVVEHYVKEAARLDALDQEKSLF